MWRTRVDTTPLRSAFKEKSQRKEHFEKNLLLRRADGVAQLQRRRRPLRSSGPVTPPPAQVSRSKFRKTQHSLHFQSLFFLSEEKMVLTVWSIQFPFQQHSIRNKKKLSLII